LKDNNTYKSQYVHSNVNDNNDDDNNCDDNYTMMMIQLNSQR